MSGELVILSFVTLVGFGVVLYAVVRLVVSVVMGIGRALAWLFGMSPQHEPGQVRPACLQTGGPRMCPAPGCGQVEYRDARFCSRCGGPLRR